MSITLGGSTEFNGVGDNTSVTISVTLDIGTRTNGILIAGISFTTPIVKTVSSAAYNAVAMAEAVEIQRNAAVGIEQTAALYALSAPANGSHTLSFTTSIALTTSEGWYIVASYWDGGHQTQASLIDQVNSGGGSTDPSLTITPTENNELIVSHYASEANSVLTAGGGQTLLNEHDFGARVAGGGYIIQTTAALATPAWAGVDDQWAMVAASFRQAPAAGAVGPLIDGHLVKHGILQGRLARA